MIQARLPVLAADASRLDWTLARYAVKVDVKSGRAFVTHQLDDAPELDRLLREGAAEWVTELRCPRTLLSRPERSRGPEQVVNLAAEDVVGDAFLIPGLVAVRNLEIRASGLDPLIWPPDTGVPIPAGWWLVRGDPQTTTPLTASLVRFRRDPDGRLAPGQMSVEEGSDGGKPFFRVTLAQDLYDRRRTDRDIQIAGLIGACGMLPRSSLGTNGGTEGDNATHPVALQLRARLEDAGVPDWTSDHFDPARAATVLEAFQESVGKEDG